MTRGQTRQDDEEELVASTLAYVPTADDGVVEVQPGGSMPAGAVPEFASRLRDKGVFVTPDQLKKLQAEAESQG